jgi:hypothetical protein
MNDNDSIIDNEPANPTSIATALTLRRPDVPVTLSELAAHRGEAVQIIEARVQVLETARLAAIRSTHPEDWVLFKTKDDRITGYLEDSGCERVRPIFGISIFDVRDPRKVVSSDGGSFAIIMRGAGSCSMTNDRVEAIDGIRESTEDFCKDLTGVKQEIRVAQAARANLDGRIVRELAGLGSVPIEELARAWKGTDKKTEHCRRGRGFGTQDERLGGRNAALPDVDPPICPHCQTKGAYRPANGNRGAFYGCPNYKKHEDKKFLVDAAKWEQEQRAKAATAAPASTSGAPAGRTSPPAASEIFGREPGQEG